MSTTEALAAFSDALAALGIHPDDVEVSLSVSDWKALDKQLARNMLTVCSKASASPARLW